MQPDSNFLSATLPNVLAGLLLAAIPFRATVDKRGGILALIVILLVVAATRRGDWRELWPRSRALQVAGLVWLLVVCVSAIFGPDPVEAFRSVRSDVLGPILAFCVMHYLTRSYDHLFAWALVCAAAQFVLSILLVLDPYQPGLDHRPAYVDVGVASSWLVVSAAWLPVLWCAPVQHRHWARPIAVVFAFSLIVAAIASYNRIVWICYAAMLTTAATWWLRSRPNRIEIKQDWRVLIVTAIAIAVLGGLAWKAVDLRAPSYQASADQSPGYVRQDPRAWIWPAGVKLAAQKPLTGFGFGVEAWKDEFARQNGSDNTPQRMNHAHNTLLNYTLQTGVAGGAVVLCLFGAMFFVFKTNRQMPNCARIVASCGAALIVGFFIRNLTDDHFLRQPLLLFAAAGGAYLGALGRIGAGQAAGIRAQAV